MIHLIKMTTMKGAVRCAVNHFHNKYDKLNFCTALIGLTYSF